MYRQWSHRIAATLTALSAVVAVGCSSDALTPTSPSLGGAPLGTSFLIGDTTSPTPEAGKIKVCKAGNVAGTFTVTGGAPATVLSPVTVPTGECRVVAENATTTGVNITVTETSAGLQSVTAVGLEGSVSFANGGVLFVNSIHGYTATFTNNVAPPPPPPPTGDKGCTPGYWKQSQHFDAWPAVYTQTTSFDTAFGIGTNWFSSSFTLLDALGQNGGAVNALARHAAAALLNSGSGFYPLTTAQVIARVQATYNGTYGVEVTKNYFAAFNEAVCPLN
jgi:hypothetical protein